MADPPVPTWIFHITAIDNLASIARSGRLLCKNQLTALRIDAASIAYENLQAKRARRVIPMRPGGSLHDYVPFMFAPRSPMLRAIDEGSVANCPYRQGDIVHLVSSVQTIVDRRLPFVFTDHHPIVAYALFFKDLADLSRIDWPLFFESPRLAGYCQYWHNPPGKPQYAKRRETRQAEFLVHGEVPLAAVVEIGVRTAEGQQRVAAALEGTGWSPTLKVVPGWYY